MGNTFFVNDTRRLSLADVLDQHYREEFLVRDPSPPQHPPAAPIEPIAFGVVGGERLHHVHQVDVQVHRPRAAFVAQGNNNHHHHVGQHHHNRRHQMDYRAPAAVQVHQAVPEPRRLCCSFCHGTAAQVAREMGLPAPEKDAFGVWSTHSCKTNGIVSCPALWAVVCPLCGATGPVAHTRAEHIRLERNGGL